MARTKITKAFSMDAEQVALLTQLGKDEGLIGPSATLRWIINDWQRMKAEQRAEANHRTAIHNESDGA